MGLAVAVPVPPKQIVVVELVGITIADGSVMLVVWVMMHPLASVIVRV